MCISSVILSDQEELVLYALCKAIVFPSHLGSEALSVGLVEGVMFAEPLISTEIGAGTCYVDSRLKKAILWCCPLIQEGYESQWKVLIRIQFW